MAYLYSRSVAARRGLSNLRRHAWRERFQQDCNKQDQDRVGNLGGAARQYRLGEAGC